MLLQLDAGHAVGVKGVVEVRHHHGLHLEGAAHLPVLDALHGGGYAPEDPELVAGQGVLPALEVGQLHAEGPHQVVVQQGVGWLLQVRGHQHGKRSAFTREDILMIIVTVLVAGCQVAVAAVVVVHCCCC